MKEALVSLKRFIITASAIGFVIAARAFFLNSAPTFAANVIGENDATTIQFAPPAQNPTLIPQTPIFGDIPPIDLNSLNDPSPTPSPTSAAGVTNPVIENSFDECPPIEDEFISVVCQNGQLAFTRKDTRSTRYVYYRPILTDAVIQVTARLPNAGKNARYGVIFRLDDEFKNYYLLGVTNEGHYGLFRFANGQYETIIPYTQSSFVGNPSFPSQIKIVNQGDVIAIQIGGQWLDSIRDPNLKAGRVALFVKPDEASQTVLFDDLRVEEILTPLPVPEPRVVPPPANPTSSSSDIPIINFGATPTASSPQPTQTPFIIVVTATPLPATSLPTRVPTRRPTQAANECAATANEAFFYISNNYPNTTMRFTIGGGAWGTHDYDVPGDGKYYLIRMPPGTYTYSAHIAGAGTAHGEKTAYNAGQCYSLRFSP